MQINIGTKGTDMLHLRWPVVGMAGLKDLVKTSALHRTMCTGVISFVGQLGKQVLQSFQVHASLSVSMMLRQQAYSYTAPLNFLLSSRARFSSRTRSWQPSQLTCPGRLGLPSPWQTTCSALGQRTTSASPSLVWATSRSTSVSPFC